MSNTNTAEAEKTDIPVEVKADLRRFNKAEEQVTKAVTALSAIVKIENPEQLAEAMTVLSNSAKVDKLIEAKRVEMVKPFNDTVKKINEFAKGLAGKLPPAITLAKNVVLAYNKEQQTILENKRKEIRGAQLIALGMTRTGDNYNYEGLAVYNSSIITLDDNQWNGFFSNLSIQVQTKKDALLVHLTETHDLNSAFGSEADAQETARKIEEVKAPVAAPVNTYAGSAQGVKGVTKRWTYSVTNEADIPREYLVIDPVKIRKAIAEGVREIAGISIFQEEGLTIR